MSSVAVASRSFSTHPVLRHELQQRYPKIAFNDTGKTLKDDELIHFLDGFEKAIIGLERLDAATLYKLPALKVVSRFGTGLDMLDLDVMRELGIKLAYTAGANKRAVSELVIAFALNMLRKLPQVNHAMRLGQWSQNKGRQLTGRRVGIIGFGAIGKDVALLFKAFHCEVFIYDLYQHDAFCLANEIQQIELDDLLEQSDIISLHIPLNHTTKNILNEQRLHLIKPTAILINTARGGLVDESILKSLLKANKIGGAAFDVFATEPTVDPELISLPNFFSTPHIGGSTEEAILAMGHEAIAGLENAVHIKR
jgi:D-3-phosphoglycerate dehydrogenase